MAESFAGLLARIKRCQVCAPHLALGPRPVVVAQPSARLLIAGQAPGARVHATGIPWNDPSGDRLRTWLGMSRDTFYDPRRVALVPMGFCYPGSGTGGDLPPRPECAREWHPTLLPRLVRVELTVVIGRHAQQYHLGTDRSVTDTVAAWQSYLPRHFPLPHPSPRNGRWLRWNPWFARELLPALQRRVAALGLG